MELRGGGWRAACTSRRRLSPSPRHSPRPPRFLLLIFCFPTYENFPFLPLLQVVEPKKKIVDEEVAKAQVAADAANAIKKECEEALAEALPILESALAALDTIKPADIKLVQSFKNPPAAIKLVLEAVCVLLDIKPARVNDPSGSGKKVDDFWEPSKKLLSDSQFLATLRSYDKDNINPKIVETIRSKYTSNPDFTPANAAKASSAAEGLCKWVFAMDQYDNVAKVVGPKRESLAQAEGE
jgi:dynein heavy chain, axonemal